MLKNVPLKQLINDFFVLDDSARSRPKAQNAEMPKMQRK